MFALSNCHQKNSLVSPILNILKIKHLLSRLAQVTKLKIKFGIADAKMAGQAHPRADTAGITPQTDNRKL